MVYSQVASFSLFIYLLIFFSQQGELKKKTIFPLLSLVCQEKRNEKFKSPVFSSIYF